MIVVHFATEEEEEVEVYPLLLETEPEEEVRARFDRMASGTHAH